jgi:mono/diheme cytochrome c family protein
VRRPGSFSILSGCCALGVTLLAYALVGSFALAVQAGQSRTVKEGVYTNEQATRGQATYKDRCAPCHGETMGGSLAPPLTGGDFIGVWGAQPLSDLVNKIKNTMPATDPGQLTRPQVADIVAYILQANKFPAGRAELAADEDVLKQITWPAGDLPQPKPITPTTAQAATSQPFGNLAQVMRGILFPSSNLIFNVQNQDPGTRKTGPGYEPGATGAFSWVDWGAGIYSPWEIVDYAAVALAESAPLLLEPGRRCENGKPVPVERADWVKYTAELVDAARAAYKASQSRNQEAVVEATNQVAEACLNCHLVYRDKPGGTRNDPSNKAARCVP